MTVLDPTARGVVDRLLALSARQRTEGLLQGREPRSDAPMDPNTYADIGFPLHPGQGELAYLLCRAARARHVVECATSFGVSTIYLAAAMRDGGGGTVIGSELVPGKAAAAHAHLAEAGLAEFVEIRVGDARDTLRDVGGPVDFLLLDGWPAHSETSLARTVIELVAPSLRHGATVLNDNGETDYLEYVRNPANGFRTTTLPLHHGTEVSLRD